MAPISMHESHDGELAIKLRRLDAAAGGAGPAFDYHGMLARDAAAKARARRRHSVARGTASALVVVMVAVSVWRFEPPREPKKVAAEVTESATQPRLVRADTYLALAAIEDHIATIDDALNDARLVAPRGAAVARLERTRAELMDSYARVRYAEMVSTNF